MQVFLFNSIPSGYWREYIDNTTNINVQLVRLVAYIVVATCGLFMVTSPFIDYSTFIPNYSEQRSILIFCAINAAVTAVVASFILKKPASVRIVWKRIFSFYFSCSLILTTLVATLVGLAAHVQLSIVIFLIGLISVASLWSFELLETLLLLLITAVVMHVGLQVMITKVPQRNLLLVIGYIHLLAFFFINRWIYSYRVNQTIQLQHIQRKNQEIERAMQARVNMLNVVAHDLRNPINAIDSITNVLENLAPTAEQDEYLKMIGISCQKARTIIDDIVDAARTDASFETILLEPVNMNALMVDVVAAWQLQMKTGHHIVLENPTKKVIAYTNKAKLTRTIDNLISNAAKFSEDGTTITLQLQSDGYTTQVAIKDQGVGIAPETLPFVFDRFTKASRNGVRGEKSIGLGLHISKQLIEQMHGTITVNSTVGVGTTFTISLPVAAAI